MERLLAGVIGLALIVIGVLMVVNPPGKEVALGGCQSAAAGCVVSVDSDLSTFGTALAALGAAAGLIALLGVRFTTVKAGGVELSSYEKATEGLPKAEPQPSPEGDSPATVHPADEVDMTEPPVKISVETGLGTELGVVPVAITHLDRRMDSTEPRFLRDYQGARRNSQRSYFLTHALGPATSPGQKYSVAIRLTPHHEPKDRATSAQFYFGRAWGSKVFEGSRGIDGRFGITTEAYGPFLVLCEVEFEDGDRIVLDHYCDFEMGVLLPA